MNKQEVDEMFDIDPQITVLHTVVDGKMVEPVALSGTMTTASGSCGPSLCATQC